jgi:hypothetical protein
MLCTKPNRMGVFSTLALLGVLYSFSDIDAARAQEPPPTTIPAGGPLYADPMAIPFNGWLLYPTVNTFAQYSNNYFLSPQAKISGWSYGVSPDMTAQWSNGIHTTTLYGTYTHIEYPTQNEVNTDDGVARFTQRYAPLRDLNFTFFGDYTHKTITSALTGAIPTVLAPSTTTVLPNGNIILPSGTIVSPSGQVVGQAGPAFNAGALSVVNPYNAFSATAEVQKIFSEGIVNLGASVLRQDYQEQVSKTEDFGARTLTENAAFWLGSVFYIYSDGSYSMRSNTLPNPDSTAYRVIGGIGTRQFGLFRASAYFGHQGSDSSGFPSAGGDVLGGLLAYYPTAYWTVTANFDETINIAPSTALPSTQALSIPIAAPLQIAVSSSTQIAATTLRSDYAISPRWTASGIFGYTRVQFLGTPGWENAWLADAILKYNIRRNLTLEWEYQYSSVVSNIPLSTAIRNFVTMSALYKF